jgi:hypothetical protein
VTNKLDSALAFEARDAIVRDFEFDLAGSTRGLLTCGLEALGSNACIGAQVVCRFTHGIVRRRLRFLNNVAVPNKGVRYTFFDGSKATRASSLVFRAAQFGELRAAKRRYTIAAPFVGCAFKVKRTKIDGRVRSTLRPSVRRFLLKFVELGRNNEVARESGRRDSANSENQNFGSTTVHQNSP